MIHRAAALPRKEASASRSPPCPAAKHAVGEKTRVVTDSFNSRSPHDASRCIATSINVPADASTSQREREGGMLATAIKSNLFYGPVFSLRSPFIYLSRIYFGASIDRAVDRF